MYHICLQIRKIKCLLNWTNEVRNKVSQDFWAKTHITNGKYIFISYNAEKHRYEAKLTLISTERNRSRKKLIKLRSRDVNVCILSFFFGLRHLYDFSTHKWVDESIEIESLDRGGGEGREWDGWFSRDETLARQRNFRPSLPSQFYPRKIFSYSSLASPAKTSSSSRPTSGAERHLGCNLCAKKRNEKRERKRKIDR